MSNTGSGASVARSDTIDILHGRAVPDPYRWLEADDDPACELWLSEQDRVLTVHSSQWPMRPFFRASLQELIDEGGTVTPRVSPPVWRDQRRFFLRRHAGQELPVLVVADGSAPEQVLINPLVIDPDGLTTLDDWRPSRTGDLVAYQTSHGSDGVSQLRVLHVPSRTVVAGPWQSSRPTPVAWLPDDTGFYYVARDKTAALQLRLHYMDAQPDDDVAVFTTASPHLSVSMSADGRWLTVSRSPGARRGNALYLADVSNGHHQKPHLELVHDGTIQDTQALLRFGPDGLLYAITDAQAPRGRVCLVDPSRPHSCDWHTVITPSPGVVLSQCLALTDSTAGTVRLLTSQSRGGQPQLSLYEITGEKVADLPTPGTGPGTISELTAPPAARDTAWFTYTDFVTAPTVHRLCLRERRPQPDPPTPAARGLQRQQPPLVEHSVYPAEDGTEIGIQLIVPYDATGPRPTILTTYGGFGATPAPGYSPTILAWVRAGGIFAIPGVRGGGDHGTTWHAAGSGPNKPTAFSDFAAAARWLIDHGWTTRAQLAVKGASHSGLMAAVALIHDPHLYAAAVCSDALTDMVRYPHLGLGQLWTKEFGDPQNPDNLDRLLSYSPYHNVRPDTAYPAVLLTSARTDPRVGSAHSRKLTAALQHATASDAPILLRTETGVGHGPRAASRWADLQADALAFCAAHTGLDALTSSPS